jgi:hypothetical protein
MTAIRPRAGERDRGAAAVEFALVVTVLVTLAFGALDYGFKWRYSHEAVAASRAGARVGSGLGDDRTADLNILATVRASLDSVGVLPSLVRIVVYDSNTLDGLPPSTCTAASPAGRCQVYPASSVASLPLDGDFDADGCMTTGSLHQGWCPGSRVTDQRNADHVGVMIVLNAPSISGVFGDSTVSRRTTMRIEPTAQ